MTLTIREDRSAAELRAYARRAPDPRAAARAYAIANALEGMTRDGRRAATHSHAQRREHGEDGEHRTFPAVSTRAPSTQVEAAHHAVLLECDPHSDTYALRVEVA